MKHLLHALESRRHKLTVSDADLDQLLSEVKDARDVKGPEQFTDSLDKVLQDLKSLPEAHAFLKPVTRADAPDYHLVIKHPMDLATMSKKVRTKQYRNKAEFIADLNLIWDNCLSYNAHPTHPLRRCANTLRKRTSILSEIIQDPADRSAPLTLRRIPQLRRRSLVDDSDDEYNSSSGTKPTTKSRALNGVINGVDKSTNGNGVVSRLSSTPESDTPIRPAAQKSRGSRRPLPEESFSERSAITRTQESMSQFTSLDKELARLELQTAGAGPSRIKEDFMSEELNRRLRNQLRQLRVNDEDVQRLDEWRDVDDGKVGGGGGKRKRVVITSSDEEEDEAPRRTKFSTTGLLPQDQDEHETHHDLWWEAVRTSGMIGNGVMPMAQHGFPDVKPVIMKRRKKRPKDTGLKYAIHKNITTLHNIRRMHTKILILNALAEENQNGNEDIPLPPDSPTTEPPILSIPGLTLADDSGAECLSRVSTTVLQHAGFEGSSQGALNVLQHVVAEYLENLGRTFRFMTDTLGKTMTNEQIVLHALAEHGISEVQELERYIKDDVERYGTRLQDLERKLTNAYDEQTQAGAMEDDELFDEENENLVMGGFAGELGEDFFGLRELGLEQEFGLTSLSIPRKLLRTRRNNAANSNAAKEPQLPYPPPPPFHPIHTANLESHIGLLHPFYASKAPIPPPPAPGTEGAADLPTGVMLPDDPVNSLKVKMGPLGQIIPVAPSASKKKGGGGGGGGGGAGGTAGGDGGVKQEGSGSGGAPSKSQKKKDKDKKPPPPPSNDPPLTMPKFGIGTAKSPIVPPAPAPEVSTMMPDFNQFVNGVHAGI
ncbi:Transcriptional activator spt7 [Rhizoctonia solani]